MQKFTLFSLLASVSVILLITDLLTHNYLKRTDFEMEAPMEETLLPETPEEETVESEEPTLEEDLENAVGLLTEDLFLQGGFESPHLEALPNYSGKIFEFIEFEIPEEAQLSAWKLFDGFEFLGTLYEFDFTNETDALTAYVELSDFSATLTELGNINETNQYGDGFFYFNHGEKEKTVFAIFKEGPRIFAFSYPYTDHEIMKGVFEILGGVSDIEENE